MDLVLNVMEELNEQELMMVDGGIVFEVSGLAFIGIVTVAVVLAKKWKLFR